MKHFVVSTLGALALQVIALILVLLGVFWAEVEALILAPLFLYYPTIFLVEHTGNFVGCANMIQPLIIGVPLGLILYSLIFGALVSKLVRSVPLTE